MIDLHSHILYGIDDGSRHRDMTLNMLRQAEEDGIKIMVATPHYVVGANLYSARTLLLRYCSLLQIIDEQGLNIKLLLGNELFLDEYIFEAVEQKMCHTLAGTKYVLLELPMAGIPPCVEGVLYQFLTKGYRPILAHPERNVGFLNNPAQLIGFLEMGCIAQINSTSINGIHGHRVQDTAKQFLRNNMAHLVASDCHSDNRRRPELSVAYNRVSQWLGKQRADELFKINPRLVLQDEVIETRRPEYIRDGRNITQIIKDCFTATK